MSKHYQTRVDLVEKNGTGHKPLGCRPCPLTSPRPLVWNAIMKRMFAAAFLCLLMWTPAQAGFDEGMAAYKKNDFPSALKEWRPLADSGNVDAQYMLGQLYFQKYLDYASAAKWYRKAAQQGHAKAQNGLASLYRTGRGVTKDIAAALKWYNRAAKQGNLNAQSQLGFMYDFGYDVGQDYAEALTWYRKAANQGYAIAQYSLGNMYRDGKGVRQNYVEAHKWYSLAAFQGNELASSGRDELSGNMTQAEIAAARKLARDWMVKQGKE